MLSVRFEPALSADKRPQTYAVDRATTGTGAHSLKCHIFAHVIVFAGIQFMIL